MKRVLAGVGTVALGLSVAAFAWAPSSRTAALVAATPVDDAYAKVQADVATLTSDVSALGVAISASQTTTTVAPPTTTTVAPTTTTVAPTTTTVAPTTTTVAPTTTTVPPTTTTVAPGGYIASNFNTAPYIINDPSPPASTSALPSSGAFRIVCSAGFLNHDDPIKFPGQVGASHLHMQFGNTLTNANSTYQSLRTTGGGTCNGGPVNRSAYWVPATFTATGTVKMPSTIVVYYKAEGLGGIETPSTIAQVQPFPAGFKFISNTQDINHHFWYCDTDTTHRATIPSCPSGTNVWAHQDFPSCWDGVIANDETSHMAYITFADTGLPHCPAGFPTRLPEVTYIVGTISDGNSANWFLASDRVAGMPVQPNGSTLHADWFGAWDPPVQTTWMTNCVKGMKSCSGGQLAGSPAKTLTPAAPYTGPTLVTGQTP